MQPRCLKTEAVGWNDPGRPFGRTVQRKAGSFQPTSVFCARPKFAMPRVQLLLIARVARVAEVNVEVNAPVNSMFQVAFTFNVQKTRIKCGDPQG